jgi:hypothetical protein
MKICDGIYLIASGSTGCGLSNPFDCDVYLVESFAGTKGPGLKGPYVPYVIVDCGVGLEPERIKQNLEESGHRPEDCTAVLLTHSLLPTWDCSPAEYMGSIEKIAFLIGRPGTYPAL